MEMPSRGHIQCYAGYWVYPPSRPRLRRFKGDLLLEPT